MPMAIPERYNTGYSIGVGGAAMHFTHDQPMIRGAQEIVPARLAQKT